MRQAPKESAVQTLPCVPGKLRRQRTQRQEKAGSAEESSEGDGTAMAKVIEFPKPHTEVMAYLTGETLLIAEEIQGKELRDTEGNPIRPGELYEVTCDGISRVA